MGRDQISQRGPFCIGKMELRNPTRKSGLGCEGCRRGNYLHEGPPHGSDLTNSQRRKGRRSEGENPESRPGTSAGGDFAAMQAGIRQPYSESKPLSPPRLGAAISAPQTSRPVKLVCLRERSPLGFSLPARSPAQQFARASPCDFAIRLLQPSEPDQIAGS